MPLTDISLLFKDIIETPQQKQQRLFAEGQAAAGQFTGLPTGLRELAMGTASGIPNMVESIRQFGATAGLPVQTQGEQLQGALSGIDTTYYPDDPNKTLLGRQQAVQAVRDINPAAAVTLSEFYREKQLEEEAAAATNRYNKARATDLEREASETAALRNLVRPLLPGSRFSNINADAFEGLDDAVLERIFTEIKSDRDLTLLHGIGDDGNQVSIYRDKNNQYYNTQDPTAVVPPEQVPEMLYNASVVASSTDDLFGGTPAQNDLLDATIQTQMLMTTTERLLALTEDNPDVLTRSADFAAWLNSQQQELLALERIMRDQAADNDRVNLDSAEIDSAWEELGFATALAKPLILSLAYSMAAAEQGAQSISDKDIVNYMKQIGEEQKDPRIMQDVLKFNAAKAWGSYKTRYGMIHPDEVPATDFGFSQIVLPTEQRKANRAAAAFRASTQQ